MLYSCRVYSGDRMQRIIVEATSQGEAASMVWRRLGAGSLVLDVQRADRQKPLSGLFGARSSPRDLELLCRRAEALLRAGVTAQEALDVLAEQSEKRVIGDALRAVAESVRAGFPLSVALRANPSVFPTEFSSTIAAAEEAGALSQAMTRLASHYNREATFRDRVKQAMTYPSVVLALAMVVTGGMFGFVVPQFAAMLLDAGVPIPPTTQAILTVSQNLPTIAVGMLVLLLAMLLMAGIARRSHRVRIIRELLVLRIPFLGKLLTRTATARTCRSLALMLMAGTPVTRSLEITRKMAGMELLALEMESVEDSVRSGGTMAATLEKSRFFPPSAVKMLAIGEMSGDLSGMLSESAALMEMELDLLMQRLPPLVETVMLIVVGANVAFVMLSLFLPIIAMYQMV